MNTREADTVPRRYKKSRLSKDAGDCVEVANDDGYDDIAVRDSKNPATEIIFSKRAWSGFLNAVKAGHFR